MDPGFNQTRMYLVEALTHAGRFDEAVAELPGMPPPHDGIGFRMYEASVQARADRPEKLRTLLHTLSSGAAESSVNPEGAAWMYGVVGEYDQAFDLLEQAYRRRNFYLVFLNADPAFDSLRSDPRFAELVHRVGIPSS
jgi:hypothetical protein